MIPIKKCKVVTQQKSNHGWLKVNTDGSYMNESGKTSIGCVIRDVNGDFVATLSFIVKYETNNITEALTINFGAKWCITQGIHSSFRIF